MPSTHFFPYKDSDEFIRAVDLPSTLLVSDASCKDLCMHSQHLDALHFCLYSWLNFIDTSKLEQCIFKLNAITSSIQHAYHSFSRRFPHLSSYFFLKNSSDSSLISLSFDLQFRIFIIDDCSHAEPNCACILSRINEFVASNSHICYFSSDLYLSALFTNILPLSSNKTVNTKSKLITIASIPPACNFDEIVIFAHQKHIPNLKEQMAHILASSSPFKSFMDIKTTKIASTIFPESSAYQILLFVFERLKSKLESINIFISDQGIRLKHDLHSTSLSLVLFSFVAEYSNQFVSKKERVNNCSIQSLKHLHSLSLVDGFLRPVMTKIQELPVVFKLLNYAYGTHVLENIEETKTQNILENIRTTHEIIQLRDGKAWLPMADPYKIAYYNFKRRYRINIEKFAKNMLEYSSEIKTQANEEKMLELIYRKIPDAMADSSVQHYLYTFTSGNTGILCSKSFSGTCILKDTIGNNIGVTHSGIFEFNTDELRLIEFYQTIFFKMHLSIFSAEDCCFQLHYYVVPLTEDKSTIDWTYLEELYNNFLISSVCEYTKPIENLIWNPFSRVFLVYVSEHDQPIETVLDGTTICQYLEDSYEVLFHSKSGPTLFQAVILEQIVSRHKKIYKSIYCRDNPRKLGKINEKESIKNINVHFKPENIVIDSKEACFVTNVRISIIHEYFIFINNFFVFENLCHAHEVATNFKMDAPLPLILEGITPESSNLFCNYERLEFLGDSSLKLVMTLVTSVLYSSLREIVAKKSSMVSNESLSLLCNKNGLYRHISLVKPYYKMLQPPSLKEMKSFRKYFQSTAIFKSDNLRGYLNTLSSSSLLEDSSGTKVYADVIEGLIGVAMLTGGTSEVLKLLFNMGFLKGWVDEEIGSLEQLLHKPIFPYRNNFTSFGCVGLISKNEILEIESLIGYKFLNPAYLEYAIIHPSYKTNLLGSDRFQLLELLGDAALDLFVVCILYNDRKLVTPLDLHNSKLSRVNNRSLARILTDTQLFRHIKIGGTMRDDVSKLSKAYGDIFEAIVGGILCDLEWNFDKFVNVMRRKILNLLESYKEDPQYFIN